MGQKGRGQEPVSVLVLAAGREATLERCLEELAKQRTEAEMVLTVVDSAPSHGAADLALRHPGVHWVVLSSKVGLLPLCQRAIGAAPFERVAVIDAAYAPAPGWLAGGLAELGRGVDLAIGAATESGFADMFLRRHVPDRIPLEECAVSGTDGLEEFVRRSEVAGFNVSIGTPSQVRAISDGSTNRSVPANVAPPTPGLVAPPLRPYGTASVCIDPQLISVILCTAGHRPDQLHRCLSSLARLDDPNFEIFLVENAVSPALAVDQLPTAVKHVHEPRRGLDRARNRGILESSGEIVAFVDDDCEVDPDWLRGIRKAFSDPAVALVTGRVRPARLDRESQQWFEAHFPFDRGPRSRRFTRYDNHWSPLLMGEVGTGANMAFRRCVLERIGGFDEKLDMGTLIGGGGDLDVLARALAEGAVGQYAADAVVFHHHRDSLRKLRWQTWGYGVSQGAMCAKFLFEWRGRRLHAVMRYVRLLLEHQRRLGASRRGADRYPPSLVRLELIGIAVGPLAYVASLIRSRQA